MTIDELNALKDWVQTYHKDDLIPFGNGKYVAFDDIHGDKIDSIVELIDAELERQSVTDKDVAEAIRRVNEQIDCLTDIINELVKEQGEDAMVEDVKEALRTEITCLAALQTYRPERELYKIAKHPNPDDLTETAIAQLTYDIERINTLRGDEWDYEPGAEEMRKELSAKYGHAINALMDYNKTVTVTWIGDPDDYPSAICSRCDHDLTIYDWYGKLVFGPRNYCPYCGGRIGKQVREEYSDEDEWEEEV